MFMEEYGQDVKAEWTEKYGSITIITFMVYGELGTQGNVILNYAIKDNFDIEKHAQLIEEIDKDKAELLNMYKGQCIQWVFPSKLKEAEHIRELISDGLTYQRLLHECIGVTTDVYERTT
tara:strand:- start:257 stop:616 length:360 start_codon:yes stop_codon:yes gene_type:complete